MATGHRYSGVNVLVLGMHPAAFQTSDPRFCTYKQAQNPCLAGQPRGAWNDGIPYKPLEIEDETAKNGKKVVLWRELHPAASEQLPLFAP